MCVQLPLVEGAGSPCWITELDKWRLPNLEI